MRNKNYTLNECMLLKLNAANADYPMMHGVSRMISQQLGIHQRFITIKTAILHVCIY